MRQILYVKIPLFFVTGKCDHFGLGFTTLNAKPLYSRRLVLVLIRSKTVNIPVNKQYKNNASIQFTYR